MKDKFDDLMYQAGLTADGCWFELDNYDQMAIMKFAELIVRECAEVCLDPNHWYEDAAGETYNRVIKQHFGVRP